MTHAPSSLGNRVLSAIASLTGSSRARNEYDAAKTSTRRQAPKQVVRSEDDELNPKKRRKLIATTLDLRRNFPLARWAINKHLDYVTRFTFQSTTGDKELNQRIEQFMKVWSRKENCDVAGRHPLARQVRLAEAAAVCHGDMAFNLLSSGRIQGIEGDRIATPNHDQPKDFDPEEWTHGVKVTKAGRAEAYAICNRDKHGRRLTLAKILPARFVVHHAFYDRFDQVRGISPIASAINDFQDIREAHAYALAKLKISQLFGLVTYRDDPEAIKEVEGSGDFGEEAPFTVDFDKGPFQLDLDSNDKAEFIGDKSPSADADRLVAKIIAIALKSLDLPQSFYDESHTNFFGSRAALMQYLQGCESKRDNVRGTLDAITEWRLRLAVLRGEIELPSGKTVDDLSWDWIHAGTPWWDPVKDLNSDVKAVASGWATNDEVCRKRTGRPFREIAEELKAEQDFIKETGVMIISPGPNVFNPEPVLAAGDEQDHAQAS